MPETSIQTPPGFSDLSKAEQVRYLQSLWDRISEHPDDIPVTESHLPLAEEQLRRYREDPSSTVLAFDVMVQRGLKDSDEGRTITNEEMHRRIKTWQRFR